jgi:hypothetical protein
MTEINVEINFRNQSALNFVTYTLPEYQFSQTVSKLCNMHDSVNI